MHLLLKELYALTSNCDDNRTTFLTLKVEQFLNSCSSLTQLTEAVREKATALKSLCEKELISIAANGALHSATTNMFKYIAGIEMKVSNYNSAISVLERLYEGFDNARQAYANMHIGICCYRLGDLEKASNCFESVVKADPLIALNRLHR